MDAFVCAHRSFVRRRGVGGYRLMRANKVRPYRVTASRHVCALPWVLFTFPFGEDSAQSARDEVYLLTDVRHRKSDFLPQTSSVSLRLPPLPTGEAFSFCANRSFVRRREAYQIKKSLRPIRTQGQLKTVLPLCFALFSQKEPREVQIHPIDVTVEPDKVYK